MTGQKLYCIVYKAHEMGDFYDDGNIRPVYYTLDKDDLEKTWEELKNEELEFFNSRKERAKQINGQPEKYTIEENCDDTLELFMENWAYRWTKADYELGKLYR